MEKEQKSVLIRIITAAVVFGIIYFLPISERIKDPAMLIPYIIVGYDVIFTALKNIVHGEFFDEKFLMALATVGAVGTGQYHEAVAVMLFYQVGEFFQDLAVDKSRDSIEELMEIKPETASVIRDGAEKSVAPEEVMPGETVVVRPGEKIPLDGQISEGTTMVDTSALTGESMPQELSQGDSVANGTINLKSPISIIVSKKYSESTVSKILELVENNAAKKARSEKFITKFAKIYTPAVVGSALLLAIAPPLMGFGDFGEWINRALTFLVVSCPCALVVSVPLSFFGGIGGASKQGILIKGASYLETLSKVGTIAFDKTGTLTKGHFEVWAVHPEAISKAELLDIAAAAEAYSTHPIAISIMEAHGGHIEKSRIKNVTELAGFGIEAQIDGRNIYVGNTKLMDRVGAKTSECGECVKQHNGGTVIHISEDSCYLGHIVIADVIKPDAKDALLNLKKLGITKTVMLTGDVRSVGESVAKELGIDEAYTELLPDMKVETIEKLIESDKGRTVAFVGDGINDAPVLTRADIGIGMGALGSDAAIEAADIVLTDDSIGKISKLIKISKKTMRIVYENIYVSLTVKLAVLALSAIGYVDMWGAVFADVGVLILAVANATRTLNAGKR